MTVFKPIGVKSERILTRNKSIHLACDDDISGRDLALEACPCLKAISVLSPISDSIHLIHGPLRCASYSWDARRCVSSGPILYKNRFSTDIDEHDDISDSERKLAQTIRKLHAVYNPAAIFVYISCVLGKINGNIKTICKSAAKELRMPVIIVGSGNFLKNRDLGYKLACNALLKLIGSKTYLPRSPYAVNILGEYNIAGGLWPVRSYFEEMGIEVISTMTGDSRVKEIQRAHCAGLNLVHCSSSMITLANELKKKYGIHYRRVSFLGIGAMSSALRNAAEFFDDPCMIDECDKMISKETKRIMRQIKHHRARIEGKQAAIYVNGASKAVSLTKALQELGMEVAIVSSLSGDWVDRQKICDAAGCNAIIQRDLNTCDLKDLLVKRKVDLLLGGIKEQFLAQELGIAFCDISCHRTFAFEGFNGITNLAREINTSMNKPTRKLTVKKESKFDSLESPKDEDPALG
ncbi:Light-independent protochlorophyllide reductase subunit B [uncultured archaeon]|nr:Light-independent protochlorophyllide reductase subunit B [uncultured archaeon]